MWLLATAVPLIAPQLCQEAQNIFAFYQIWIQQMVCFRPLLIGTCRMMKYHFIISCFDLVSWQKLKHCQNPTAFFSFYRKLHGFQTCLLVLGLKWSKDTLNCKICGRLKGKLKIRRGRCKNLWWAIQKMMLRPTDDLKLQQPKAKIWVRLKQSIRTCAFYIWCLPFFVLSIKGERNKKLNTTIISNKRVMPKEDLTW